MRRSHRLRRLVRGSGAGILLLGLVAGCGGSDDGKDKGKDEASAGAESGDEDYVPVGDDVELTPPGTSLELGEAGVVGWQPRQDAVAVAEVSVDRIDVTSFEESFEGWIIDDEMKTQTPYFARVSVTNVGEDDLGGRDVPLYAVDDTGILVRPTMFQEETFEPCPGGALPKRFPADDTAKLCLVFLLAEDRELEAVAFQPAEADAISWTGEVTEIKRPAKGKKGKKRP